MSENKKVKTAVIFMAEGMEMCECLLTVDILRRAGINVVTASVMNSRQVTSSHKVTVVADAMAVDIDYSEADIVILPGGRVGTENLSKSDIVAEQCRAFAGDKNKLVAAICAAPSVLSMLGLLSGRKATCHPDFESKVLETSSQLTELTHESVTVDGNIITGQGLGATMDFALCIAEILAGRAKAEEITRQICYRFQN